MNLSKKIAIIHQNQQITYSSLNYKSNQLARFLISKNLQIGDNVAIILNRSINQIAAILAVLKAGAAYVPINTNHPEQRINSILEDCKSKIIINDDLIDEFGKSNLSGKSINLKINPKNLAYIIYTSGSTGKPKGVMVSHSSLSKRVSWLKSQFKLSKEDKILQNTHYSFDISLAEIFWPLASGASLILSDEKKSLNANYLINLIKENKITASCIVPSALNQIIQNSQSTDLESLKLILSCGEALPRNLVDDFFEKSSANLFNLYGPTEDTIYASFKKCSINDEIITIGKPIPNTDCYILNDALKPQNIGSVGELYLGGDALATGYLNQEDLTKEKFIKNPFGKGLIYKTADLASFNEDGEMLFLGRKDDQVKLRGFRIELEEINNVLLKHQDITDAASTIKGQNKQIYLYYASDNELDNLREFAQKFLPEYMVPSRFIKMNEIPHLSSGKINHKALQELKDDVAKKNLIPASTKQEIALVKIFSQILNVDSAKIGINSNFFELGGDSLMLIELSCALEKATIFIEPHELFIHRDISNILKNSHNYKKIVSSQSQISGEINPLPRQIKFFQDGISIRNHWNRAMMLEFKQNVNLQMLQESLDKVVSHHDGLRLSFAQNGDDLKVFNHSEDVKSIILDFDLTPIKKLNQQERINEILNENHQFKLTEAPLIKIIHFNLSSRRNILAILVHHLLIDMRSLRIIIEDILHLYRQKILKLPAFLPPKTTSLKEYSHRLNKYEIDQNQVKYWINELGEGSRSKDIIEGNQITKNITLEKKESANIIQNNQNISVNEYLLTAFSKTFKKWSGENELILNTCCHGREKIFEDVDLSRTIGWVNTVYPLRIDLKEQDSIAEQIIEKTSKAKIDSINYMALRFSKNHPELQLPEPRIFFNYVSKIDTSAPEGFDVKLIANPKNIPSVNQKNKACYDLYLEAAIVEEKISINITYASEIFNEQNISELINEFIANLS
ncbi:MAG: amino acid adenylation domain-containing protein [Lentimonas sp.]|jgi:amino acid adenylation domain-containing protein